MSFLQQLTSPSAQTLRVLQPTPSTISYTVSTRPIRNTFPVILAYYIGILIRVLVGLSTLALLWTKRCIASSQLPPSLFKLFDSPNGAHLLALLSTAQWRYIAPLALPTLFLVFRRPYTEESLTLLRGLGVQTSTTSSTYLRTPITRFIPTTSIQDIFIHEAFKGFEIRFYLAIVVSGEQDVVVVFPQLLPRRAVLEEVWRGCRACLWEGGGKVDKAEEKDNEKEGEKKRDAE